MAKRLIDTEMWRKPWFRKLKAQYKCFWNYLLSNCNHAGIWEVDFDLATFQIGETIKESTATEIFRDQVLIFDNGRKWLILGFVRFQYGKDLNEKSPVHKKVIDTLIGYKINGYTLYDTLYNRVCDTPKEEDKEKEEDKDKEEEEEKEGESCVLEIYPTFSDFWNLYDKKEDREKCEKKWKNLKQRDKEQIMEHLPLYVVATPDKHFRKNPSTYLNNKAWENEVIVPSTPANNTWNNFKQSNISSSEQLKQHFEREEFNKG